MRLYVFDSSGEHLASVRRSSDAVLLCIGKGRIIRWGYRGRILWSEGFEEFSASESFDKAAKIVWDRMSDLAYQEFYEKGGVKI